MFGFTAGEVALAADAAVLDGPSASATLVKEGVIYTIHLSQTQNVTGIWVIDQIDVKR
jgi:hypothetical protein